MGIKTLEDVIIVVVMDEKGTVVVSLMVTILVVFFVSDGHARIGSIVAYAERKIKEGVLVDDGKVMEKSLGSPNVAVDARSREVLST